MHATSPKEKEKIKEKTTLIIPPMKITSLIMSLVHFVRNLSATKSALNN